MKYVSVILLLYFQKSLILRVFLVLRLSSLQVVSMCKIMKCTLLVYSIFVLYDMSCPFPILPIPSSIMLIFIIAFSWSHAIIYKKISTVACSA